MRLIWLVFALAFASVIGIQNVDARCLGEPCRPPMPHWVDPLMFYAQSDVVVIGTVIDQRNQSSDLDVLELYDVQVEQYLKNTQDTNIISTLGQPQLRPAYWYYQTFEVGDRVILYLQHASSEITSQFQHVYAVDDRANPHFVDYSINRMPTRAEQIQTLEQGQYVSFFRGLDEIVCPFDKSAVYKKSEIYPVCVNPDTAEKLVLRNGWSYETNNPVDPNSHKIQITTDKIRYQQNDKIVINVKNIGTIPLEIRDSYLSLRYQGDNHDVNWGYFPRGFNTLEPDEEYIKSRLAVDYGQKLRTGVYDVVVNYEVMQENKIPLFFEDTHTIEIIESDDMSYVTNLNKTASPVIHFEFEELD